MTNSMFFFARHLEISSSWLSPKPAQHHIAFPNSTGDETSATSGRSVSFEALPLRPNDPPFSAWGLWGEDDELGSLNLLTPATVQAASKEVVHGLRVPLNLPLESPQRPMNPVRKPCEHRIIAKGNANDDELAINTQGSSHFDGLRHYPYQHTLQYYNGITQDDITGPNANDKIGIQNIARCGIAGRGVLLDWRRYAIARGIEYSPFERHTITLEELKEVAKLQGVEFRAGDILLIRTGWTEEFNKLDDRAQRQLPDREIRASCGVQASREMLEWHWNNAFAAVASDTVAYEVWPSPREIGVAIHEVFLSGWGMPIGESWDLEELSHNCATLKKWTFFLTSQPLNIRKGVASPSNALAIL